MAKCEIKTGKVIAEKKASTTLPPSKGDGAVGIVVFDSKSVSQWSDVFRVHSGESVIVSAYGLSSEAIDEGPNRFMGCESVAVYRLSPIVHKIPNGDACAGAEVMAEPLPMIRQQVKGATRCDGWELVCGSPIGVIALPGYYRLRLSHEHMIGQVYVERESIRAVPIPNSLIFGGV